MLGCGPRVPVSCTASVCGGTGAQVGGSFPLGSRRSETPPESLAHNLHISSALRVRPTSLVYEYDLCNATNPVPAVLGLLPRVWWEAETRPKRPRTAPALSPRRDTKVANGSCTGCLSVGQTCPTAARAAIAERATVLAWNCHGGARQPRAAPDSCQMCLARPQHLSQERR